MGAIRNIFTSRSEKDGNFFGLVQKIIGFKPKRLQFYEEAFTHRSLGLQNKKGHPFNYERLEFLGDAMLGAVIAAHLFDEVGRGDEGYLTKMRSKVVSREHLNELGRDLGLLNLVRAAIPKENFGVNIHGNLFEALVGAIYKDRGYKYARKFINARVIDPYVDIEKLEGRVISYKSLLIEWCQKEKKSFNFNTYEDSGQDVIRHFSVKLSIDGKQVAKARATSKKKAEEKASKRAYYVFQNKIDLQQFN
ncbi:MULTISPECIES: ribonuclease III [unclassified Leeuwenhoekiella]|uniref:ribonuclease III n=1 Tax=unclassified Leeuwenhoekiella TaxID=2615029 RepID=UPI000C4D371D|nr:MULTISPECIES: ribonuclease III [unclassified Leeuwenhoekiella]MAW95902.1 ribonuclease III [Leeuwenhoekiella sp.]MBA82827.1 ribonuclease III [Leeuwenhoekiella sp.]|tara:strand:+ start:1516 stop:2262 length:747 start_codon:yes stop_codon:yes gene_type:complete